MQCRYDSTCHKGVDYLKHKLQGNHTTSIQSLVKSLISTGELRKGQMICSEEIVDTIKAHCRHCYIRANRCSVFYDDSILTNDFNSDVRDIVEFYNLAWWKGKNL